MTLGIRLKLLLITGFIVFTVVSLHFYIQTETQREVFQGELDKRITLMKTNLQQQALTEITLIRRKIEEDLASYNLLALIQGVKETVAKKAIIEQAILVDNNQSISVHTQYPKLQQTTFLGLDYTKQYEAKKGTLSNYPIIHWYEENLERKLSFEVPINLGALIWGTLYITYSLDELNNQIEQSRIEHEKVIRHQTVKAFYVAATIFLLAYVALTNLSKRLVRPIIQLSALTKEVADGHFSAARETVYKGNDEVGELNRNFSLMGAKLQDSYFQLEEYNQNLEQKVQERTEELHDKNTELFKALRDLEESQQQLIHSEKMAALGQLIAGIAHEINTPLGAIQASIGNSSKYLGSFITLLPDFLETTSKQEQQFFCLLLTEANHKKRRTTREERLQKRQLRTALQDENISDADELSELLVDLAAEKPVEDFLNDLRMPNALKIVELAHGLSGIGRNCETITTAVSRASKVVFALKHFAHHDSSGKMILADINKGIQTVLVLYHNMIKQGCQITENYSDLPEVMCFPDELNQVWTNLIHNALHAIQNEGSLAIESKTEGEWIVVTFKDNGPGIPKEIQHKIFESFFTTKPAGEGSGLGLGICKRIIDKHQGTLTFTSEPGSTCFMVRLPLQVNTEPDSKDGNQANVTT